MQPFWAALTLEDRARYMRRAVDVLLADLDEIADLLTNEQGKPRVESYTMELLPTVDSLKWIADNGPSILSDEKLSMPLFLKSKSAKLTFEPIGVVGVIAPWNYPWSIPFGEVAIALMAGNGVVLKPASLTPLIGDRIRQTFEKAGLPEGLIRTVHGGGRIGDALVKSTAGKIFFTGSVEVGRKVGVECAKRMKGSVLELGGKDPQIVCADADLANAVSGAVWGGFANAGQTCSGIERVYVVDQVADAFLEGVVRETERLTVGDPREWTTEIGPMISGGPGEDRDGVGRRRRQERREEAHRRPHRGQGHEGGFIAPVVLTGVTHEMRIMKEEIFGPVLPVMTVESEQEAMSLANDSEFGLGASVWTKDRAKGERMAHQIESGMVWVNDHSFSHGACQCAWGGVKDSGLGRSHSKFGFYECVNIKQLAWEPGFTRDMWWQPYDRKLGDAIRLLGADPLQPQRQPIGGAARGHPATGGGHAADDAEGPLAPPPESEVFDDATRGSCVACLAGCACVGNSSVVAGTLLVAAAGLALLGPALAPAKKGKSKVHSPGKLVVATQGYTLDKVDDRTRMTVSCPGAKEPYGGGFLTSPAPGDDGQGVYPNSYERLGQQRGYHITAALINPNKTQVVPRNLTLQVICGKKIGKISDPHVVQELEARRRARTLVAKCPKKQSLIGGGYQRSNGVTDAGVMTTESHRTSARTWQVVATDPGGFAGEAVSIGYCVRSKRPLISEIGASVTIPSRGTATATTAPCPAGRQLAFSGFSAPPGGSIRFLGEGFNPNASTSATGYNSGAPATLTAYSYCLRVSIPSRGLIP